MSSRGHAPAEVEGSEDPPAAGAPAPPEAPKHTSSTRQAWGALHSGPGPTPVPEPMPVPEGQLCHPWPRAAQGWGSLTLHLAGRNPALRLDDQRGHWWRAPVVRHACVCLSVCGGRECVFLCVCV